MILVVQGPVQESLIGPNTFGSKLCSMMASDEVQELPALFATATREKPQRTYSHKGRTNRAVSLPALKPTLLDASTPANTGVKLKRFRIGNAKSWELKPVHPGPIEEFLTVQAGEEEWAGNDHNDGGAGEIGPLVYEQAQEMDEMSVMNNEEYITSPAAPPKHSPAMSDSEYSDEAEAEDEDDDELIILSQRPFGSNVKHDRRTGNGTRSLRRRPYLIFDRTEAKGYKQLKNKTQATKTPLTLRYQPGDGFLGREAKPNGSNLLTRSGKQVITGLPVGILDLTQPDPTPPKKKRPVRRANLDDNSFAPAPKKRARRPLEPKDSNQKPRPPTTTPVPVKKSSFALSVEDEIKTAPVVQRPETEHTETSQVHKSAATDDRVQAHAAQQTIPDDNEEVDMITIERSNDAQEKHTRTNIKHHGVPKEGQDSCGTHVTDSPPPQPRVRAKSLSVEKRPEPGAGEAQPSGRVFRRVHTQ